MGFDLTALRDAVAAHGRVVRVVIAAIKGSSPRETGTAMLVWNSGQVGTIGGGALEYQAAGTARSLEADRLSHHALGPELGQCCGGAITLLFEIYDAARVATITGETVARPAAEACDMPLAVKRVLTKARNQGHQVAPGLVDGWMIEPVHRPTRQIWVWGAGHVGRAIVSCLAPLPELAITWVDTGADRFPAVVPETVTALPASRPADLAVHAPPEAEHLILTYSHQIDLDLCHALLQRGFSFCGLIGSATKWARFRSRLGQLGHSPARISRIHCPIGRPDLGKHPQAIALGVATALLESQETAMGTIKESHA